MAVVVEVWGWADTRLRQTVGWVVQARLPGRRVGAGACLSYPRRQMRSRFVFRAPARSRRALIAAPAALPALRPPRPALRAPACSTQCRGASCCGAVVSVVSSRANRVCVGMKIDLHSRIVILFFQVHREVTLNVRRDRWSSRAADKFTAFIRRPAKILVLSFYSGNLITCRRKWN